jgi:hypothetical protein
MVEPWCALAIVLKFPVAGFHISVARIAPAASLLALFVPPVTSTLPFGRSVAFIWRRAFAMLPTLLQAGVAWLRSMISAVSVMRNCRPETSVRFYSHTAK